MAKGRSQPLDLGKFNTRSVLVLAAANSHLTLSCPFHSSSAEPIYGFLSVEWGLLADIGAQTLRATCEHDLRSSTSTTTHPDIESESLRKCCGSNRETHPTLRQAALHRVMLRAGFTCQAIIRLFCCTLRRYRWSGFGITSAPECA